MKGFTTIQAKINWDKLVDYSYQYANKAAVKRLGYIAESLDIASTYLPRLHEVIIDARDYVLLDPIDEKKGKYHKKWYLRINIENIKEYLNR